MPFWDVLVEIGTPILLLAGLLALPVLLRRWYGQDDAYLTWRTAARALGLKWWPDQGPFPGRLRGFMHYCGVEVSARHAPDGVIEAVFRVHGPGERFGAARPPSEPTRRPIREIMSRIWGKAEGEDGGTPELIATPAAFPVLPSALVPSIYRGPARREGEDLVLAVPVAGLESWEITRILADMVGYVQAQARAAATVAERPRARTPEPRGALRTGHTGYHRAPLALPPGHYIEDSPEPSGTPTAAPGDGSGPATAKGAGAGAGAAVGGDAGTRLRASHSLSEIRRSHLRRMAENPTVPQAGRREAAERLVAELAPEAARGWAAEMLGSDTSALRALAVCVYLRQRDGTAHAAVLRRATDADPEVTAAVAEYLGELGGVADADLLLGMLYRPEHPVRVAAAAALGKVGDLRAVERLSAVMNGSWSLSGRDLKEAAQAAIVAIQARHGERTPGALSLAVPAPEVGALSYAREAGELSVVREGEAPPGAETAAEAVAGGEAAAASDAAQQPRPESRADTV